MKDYYQFFIYCSGKSGSTTLYKTLGKMYKTIHIHGNADYKNNYPQNNNTIFDVIDYSKQKYKNIFIIDCYRTPIERKISSFFHHVEKYVPNYRTMPTEDLISYFNEKLLFTIEEYHSINEVMKHYDVPLFKKFDFKKGYNVAIKENIVFIKILFKDIDLWPNILSKIFKINIPKLINANLSENKDTFDKYNEFKKKYKVKKEYLQHLQTKDPEFLIYNTPIEQDAYIYQWFHFS